MTTLHIVGFPHTRIEPSFSTCAYSMKLLKFTKMMQRGERKMVLYAAEGSEGNGSEVVPLLSENERIGIFGPDNLNACPAWPTDKQWALFNTRAIDEIRKRAEPHDLILLSAGLSQKPIADAFPGMIVCEPGVGYEGVFSNFRAYESQAWMHYLYGKYNYGDGRWFDTVIPNYFDPTDFKAPTTEKVGDGYLLFVGRLVQRKGPQIAAQIATELDRPLLVAGPGATSWERGKIVCPEVTIQGPTVEYVGPVGVKERAELMAGASCLLAPTTYIEPFGGVAVEAMMCGTPVVSSNWGAFTETVREGVSGYRFNLMREGCAAVDKAAALNRHEVRNYALRNYSLYRVKDQFERWFDQLDTLWGDGWYQR